MLNWKRKKRKKLRKEKTPFLSNRSPFVLLSLSLSLSINQSSIGGMRCSARTQAHNVLLVFGKRMRWNILVNRKLWADLLPPLQCVFLFNENIGTQAHTFWLLIVQQVAKTDRCNRQLLLLLLLLLGQKSWKNLTVKAVYFFGDLWWSFVVVVLVVVVKCSFWQGDGAIN